jgi:hypothetical protein
MLRSKRYRRHAVPSVPTVPALRAFQTARVRPFIMEIGSKRSTASLRSNRLGFLGLGAGTSTILEFRAVELRTKPVESTIERRVRRWLID